VPPRGDIFRKSRFPGVWLETRKTDALVEVTDSRFRVQTFEGTGASAVGLTNTSTRNGTPRGKKEKMLRFGDLECDSEVPGWFPSCLLRVEPKRFETGIRRDRGREPHRGPLGGPETSVGEKKKKTSLGDKNMLR